MDPEKAKNFRPSSQIYHYTSRDTIIYALGIGAKTETDLQFLYENHENFQVFPTFVVAPGLLANSLSDWPGIAFDLTKILHGEQYIELFEPLPAGEGELRSETRVLDVLDKGSGALILTEVTTYDNRSNRKLSVQQFSVFQVGAGNFGGSRVSDAERKAPNVPTTPPTKVVEEKVDKDQATLYRLGGGDLNPLHIDSEFAQVSGFKKPILHGLCSLGFSARAILREFGGNDASNFHAMKVRFSSPVIPGQTLVTEMWKDGRRIHFQAKVKETGKVVLSNGYVDLHVDRPATVTELPTQVVDLKSKEVFDAISAELPNNKETAVKVNALVLYDITKDGKYADSYTLDLRKSTGGVVCPGKPKDGAKPTVTVTVDDEDFVKLATGKLEGIKCTSDCHPNSCEHLCNWLIPIALGKNIAAPQKNNCQLM